MEVHEMYESPPQSTVHLSVQGRHRLQEPPSILNTNGGGGGSCDTDRQAREELFPLLYYSLSLCSYCFMGLLVKMAKRERE